VSKQEIAVRSDAASDLRGATEPIQKSALRPTAYVIQGKLPFGDWVLHGRRLGVIGRSAGWWIGDWLRYGNAKYGERYAHAATITGYDTQTLMNMVYVASRFDGARRRQGLSWSHHAEVAALPPEEQERWLTRAEADRLSVRCLREELRRERRALNAGREKHLPAGNGAARESASASHHLRCPACGEVLGEADVAPVAV
jgi:hypothetical protein